MNSARDLARHASRYCAPGEVPARNNCPRTTRASGVLGSAAVSLTIRIAYSRSRSRRSTSFTALLQSAIRIPQSAMSVVSCNRFGGKFEAHVRPDLRAALEHVFIQFHDLGISRATP